MILGLQSPSVEMVRMVLCVGIAGISVVAVLALVMELRTRYLLKRGWHYSQRGQQQPRSDVDDVNPYDPPRFGC